MCLRARHLCLMTEIFLLRLIVSFFAGGGIVLLAIFLAQKLGSRLGGLLSGFPTIIFVSLLLIGVFVSAEAAQTASISALVALSFFGIFACIYVRFHKQSIWVSLPLAILGWLIAASIFNAFKIDTYWMALAIFLCVVIGSLGFLRFQDTPASFSSDVAKPKWSYVLRFMLGGLTVSGAYLLSVVAGERVGGIWASFPALAISSVIILNHLEGKAFTASFIKNVFSSAAVNCGIYISGVYFTYVAFGVLWGTIMTAAITICSTAVLIYLSSFIKKV